MPEYGASKFRTVLRNDGYYWLVYDNPTKGIYLYLYRQGKVGDRISHEGYRNINSR